MLVVAVSVAHLGKGSMCASICKEWQGVVACRGNDGVSSVKDTRVRGGGEV